MYTRGPSCNCEEYIRKTFWIFYFIELLLHLLDLGHLIVGSTYSSGRLIFQITPECKLNVYGR